MCDPGAWPVSQVPDLCAANIAIKADASPGLGFSTDSWVEARGRSPMDCLSQNKI